MAQQNDLERYVKTLKAALTHASTGLNSYITAVNSNVDDTAPQLSLLDYTNGITIQWIRNKVLNYNPWLAISVQSAESQAIGSHTHKKYELHIDIAFGDAGQDNLVAFRAYRYQRALENFMLAHWDKIFPDPQSKMSIKVPFSFEFQKGTPLFSVGIQVNFEIT